MLLSCVLGARALLLLARPKLSISSVALCAIFILYIPPDLCCQRSAQLFISIALHTSPASSAPYNCILYLSNPNVLYQNSWLSDISRGLYILLVCGVKELIYVGVSLSSPFPNHLRFAISAEGAIYHSSTSKPITRRRTYSAYYHSIYSVRLSLQPPAACYN